MEILCETAPVANNPIFRELTDSLAQKAAHGNITDSTALGEAGKEQLHDAVNKLRENMQIGRIVRETGRIGIYLHHDGKKAVFVLKDGKVQLVFIRVGEEASGGFELLEGPPPGTRVVKDPAATLRDGQSVKEGSS